jgi:hypothetical protein
MERLSFKLDIPYSRRCLEDVDFCVWVLEADGLKVPPFDKHAHGSKLLRRKGLDSSSWQNWVKGIVLLLDQRLDWHVENIEIAVQTFLNSKSCESWKEFTRQDGHSDSDVARAVKELFLRGEERFQSAAAAAKLHLGFEVQQKRPYSPVELWQGSLGVKEVLQEMWEEYQTGVKQRRAGYPYTSGNNFILRTANYSSYSEDRVLMVYLVDYPELIEYSVPPCSVIVSIMKD